MLKQYFLIISGLIILTVFSRAYGQTHFKNDLTAKEEFEHLRLSPANKNTTQKIIDIARYFADKPGGLPANINMAKNIGALGLSMSVTLKDTALQILSHIVLSETYRQTYQLHAAVQHRDRALVLAANSNYPAEAAQAYMEAANYYKPSLENNGIQKRIAYYSRAIRYLGKLCLIQKSLPMH